ncbi:L-aspartate oxidase [Synechococcus sp. CBW1002]|nr:L-aspartate oxidase [Synechococcus sp. CBW1002]
MGDAVTQADDSSERSPFQRSWDVVVVGSGAAGLMACLELPPELRVLLLSKDSEPRSASRWAQGGIAAVTRPDDSFASHIADTLKAGAGLCDPAAVELLVRQAPACVERLLSLDMAFDRHGAELSTTLEAAHSHRRVLHAQDRTGGALVEALERRALQRPGLCCLKGAVALQLWVSAGRCRGLQVLHQQELGWIRSGAVVLACGGGGHLFAHTTNPSQSSGDGVAMAWRAGAELRDLEFVQFHPTALMLPDAPHFLISEAVRGEGGRLLDGAGASPVAGLSGGDLAPRDQVSRALARRMRELRTDHLWLDLRPVGGERLERQFPTILRRCRELGLEPTRNPIPVAPAAHYWMGGVATDLEAATSLPGLYAVGEVACTGVHGANRLASNSLMECLVFARQLRQLQPADSDGATAPITAHGRRFSLEALAPGLTLPDPDVLRARIQALRRLCWQEAGVERSGSGLRRALAWVQERAGLWPSGSLDGRLAHLEPGDRLGLEPSAAAALQRGQNLQQRLVLAERLIEAALFRQESRGGHFRTDVPAPQPFWQRHSVQRLGHPVQTAPVGQLVNPVNVDSGAAQDR